MNKKILSAAALAVIFAMGFLYLNQNYLIANDKNKTCSKTSGSCDKDKNSGNSVIKAGGEWNAYEFTTDQACCEEMKTDLQKELSTVAGVKEIKFSETCKVSKMTNVTVYYAAGETSEQTIAEFVKNKSYDCSGKTGCDKKSGTKSGDTKMDNGCDPQKQCPGKEKKSGESKQL